MWHTRQVSTWVLLGVAASLLELALLRLLVERLNWPLPLSTAVAAEVLILVKFLVNDRFVFGHTWPTLARLLKYHGASAGALLAYWSVVNSLAVVFSLPYMIAFFIGTAAAFAWSLATNFLWVWAPPRPATTEVPLPATPEHLRTGPPA